MKHVGSESLKQINNVKARYHEIAAIIERHTTNSGEDKTDVPGLYLSKKDAPSAPRYLAQWPCIALVIQGRKSVVLGHDTFHYGVGDYLLISVDLPVISQVTAATKKNPHLGLGMEIHPNRLHQLLRRIDMPKPASKMQEVKGLTVNKAPIELLDALLRLLKLLDRKKDIAALAPLIEEEILYHLITGPYAGQLLAFCMHDTPGNKIANAVSWLRDNYTEQVKIVDLAEKVGMSESSFHEHFKSITTLTPIQFQKQLRLHEARKLILLNQLSASEAAYQVGYQSPSQFNREYSRLYGKSPMQDVKEMRGEKIKI